MQKTTILLVEDEKIVALDMKQQLNNLGYEVRAIVRSGKDAIEFVKNEQPDVILMDINLHGSLDGVETAAEITKDFLIPIIYVTAYEDDDLLERIKAGSSYGYILKPYAPRVLKVMIEMALYKCDLKRQLIERTENLECQNDRVKLLFKELEEKNKELVVYKNNLQEIVEDSTRQAQKALWEAEKANKAKTEFLANISHELRTPLHSILSFARLGAEKINNLDRGKLVYYFKEIIKNGDNLFALLSDLIEMSRLEVYGVSYMFDEIQLSSLVFEVVDELCPVYVDKQIKFELDKCEFVDTVAVDKLRIVQVLRNVIVNAIKFTSPGGIIRFNFEDQNDQILLSVSDTGIGIPETELESVFNKFAQSSRTSKGTGGSGLGLAIARQIMLDHGGKIWAEQNSDGGATFCMLLNKKKSFNSSRKYKRLGELLVEEGIVSEEQLESVLRKQARLVSAGRKKSKVDLNMAQQPLFEQ